MKSANIIRKTVIPAAGFGTRMLPAAKVVPKELLPVLDKPAIQHVVEESIAAGIENVLIVISPGKQAVVDHFRPNAELEQRLKDTGRESMLASIAGIREKAWLSSVFQHEQLGLGHAILQAREHVGDESFLCQLGDAVFTGDDLPARELVEAHAKLQAEHGKCSVVALERVSDDRVSRYGIVGGTSQGDRLLRVKELVEKPTPEAAPSNLAIAARYVLSPGIFPILADLPAGVSGEIQLTDAIQKLLETEPVFGLVVTARRHDIGDPLDWLLTNLAFAKQDPLMWREVDRFLST